MHGAQAHMPEGKRSQEEKMVLCCSFADNELGFFNVLGEN
jgi:hypothetical protein